jgi:hypothetical protein
MEWLDSLWAWVMSLLASLFTLFTSVSEARSVESVEAQARASQTHPPLMDPLGASDKAAEVFEALAAQVPPMLVELPAAEGDAPPNM